MVKQTSEIEQVVNYYPMAVLISDREDRILYANEKAEDYFRVKVPDDKSVNKIDYLHRQNPAKWRNAREAAFTKGSAHFEGKSKKQTGGSIQVDVNCRRINFRGKEALVSYIRDISDQKIIEQELMKEQQMRQLILDSIPALIFVKDRENKILAMNRTYQEVTGLKIEEVLGKPVNEYIDDPELADKYWKDDLEVIETGIPKRNIIEPLLNNPKKWFITDKIPYRSHSGEIIGIIGFSIDITERKLAEESLVRSEKKFRMLFETSPDGIVLSSLKGKINAANRAFQNLLGYSADEIENLHYTDFTPDEYHPMELKLIERGQDSDKISDTIEKEYITKSGNRIPVKVTGWIIHDENGKPFQLGVYVKDLTYEIKARELEKSLLQKEKEELERDLETKNKELNMKVAQLIEKNELVNDVVDDLEDLIEEKPRTVHEQIQSIIKNLKHHEKEDFWSQFEYTFGQVNQSFYKNLFNRFPNLTNNEKKICAFLKMNLSTKDISNITHQSVRSIEMARSRMRKKMKLPRKENLSKFLNQF